MNMMKHAALGLSFSLMAAVAPLASAASWVEITNPAMGGFSVGGQMVTYGPNAASTVWVYDGANPPGSQSPAAIRTLINTQFGLPSSGVGSITLTSDGDLSSSTSSSFAVGGTFDYLAIHYGKGELLFHWSQPQAANTQFSIGNLPRGISNFRAYNSVTAVPEPATYGMLMLGMGVLGLMARRRHS